MLSFTHPSAVYALYDGLDCNDRGDHDVWFTSYNSPVEGSVLSRLKEILGKLLDVTVVGEDGHATFGKVLCISLQAGGAGEWAGGAASSELLSQRYYTHYNVGGSNDFSRRMSKRLDDARMGSALRATAGE